MYSEILLQTSPSLRREHVDLDVDVDVNMWIWMWIWRVQPNLLVVFAVP